MLFAVLRTADLTHRFLACKAHLNMLIENALYKFITISRKVVKKKHKNVRDNAEKHYGKLSIGVNENMTAMLSKTSPRNTCSCFVTDIEI